MLIFFSNYKLCSHCTCVGLSRGTPRPATEVPAPGADSGRGDHGRRAPAAPRHPQGTPPRRGPAARRLCGCQRGQPLAGRPGRWAAACVAHILLLRAGELQHLRCGDVTQTTQNGRRCLLFHVLPIKGAPGVARPRHPIIVPAVPHDPACPVAAVARLLSNLRLYRN